MLDRPVRGVLFDFAGVVGEFRMAMKGEDGDSPYRVVLHRRVVDGIDRLRSLGFRTALVTNNDRFSFEMHFPDVDLHALFDVVVFSSDVGVEKPSARIFTTTLEQLGIDASDAVFVDDVANNVDGAVAAGLQGVVADSIDTTLALIDEVASSAQ